MPRGHIRVVAPAGSFDAEAFARGVKCLRTRYRVSYDDAIMERRGYLAGDDGRRLKELVEAIEDPDVDAIVAARGGYGTTRLLDGLNPQLVVDNPKLLVGFSDITALHALWARAGVGSLHGSMVATLGGLNEALSTRWMRAAEGALPPELTDLTALSPGRASGPLLGGNLAVLSALVGTAHFPPIDGAVLFLEDVSERPYRVDRMLTSWRSAGLLTRPAAVVLGAFCQCESATDGVGVEEVLAERLGDLGVPVLMGLPAGHLDDNLELPFGHRVQVDGDGGRLSFEQTEC